MSFSPVRAVAVTSDNLTSNVPEAMPAAWNNLTSYGEGDSVALITGTVGEVYESRVAANLGNDPAASPDQWRHVATVYAAWNGGTNYAAEVWVTRVGKLWRSLTAGNLNNPPESNPDKWQDRGATNRLSMIDLKTGTLSSRYGPMTFSVAAIGRVDTVALLNVSASSATIAMMVAGEEVFSGTYSLVSTSGISNWFRWLFEPIVRKRRLVVTDLPNYANPVITVTLDGDETVSLGQFVAGHARYIGEVQWDAESGITDFSTKDKDQWGNWFISEGDFSDTGQLTVEVPSQDHDAVKELLTALRATPTLYIGSRIYSSHSFFGILPDWKLRARSAFSLLNLTYEGM